MAFILYKIIQAYKYNLDIHLWNKINIYCTGRIDTLPIAIQ